jgi:hypothetical protein
MSSARHVVAKPTDEQRLQIGRPHMIGPSVSADRGRMAAPIIRAIDQQAANAHVAQLGKGDLLRAGHTAIEARRQRPDNTAKRQDTDIGLGQPVVREVRPRAYSA